MASVCLTVEKPLFPLYQWYNMNTTVFKRVFSLLQIQFNKENNHWSCKRMLQTLSLCAVEDKFRHYQQQNPLLH